MRQFANVVQNTAVSDIIFRKTGNAVTIDSWKVNKADINCEVILGSDAKDPKRCGR